MIGEGLEKDASIGDEVIRVLEANLDDMNPQIYGYFLEKALAAGALDVFATPVQMKKNRPGFLITVLCSPESESKFQQMLFAETTTLGVRSMSAHRRILPREWVKVSTKFGDIRMKVSRVNGDIRQAAPEFDDCRKLASEKNVPLQQILDEAMRQWSARD